MQISEHTQNKVYKMLSTLTIEQIKECKKSSWKLARLGPKAMDEWERQCQFMIDRKEGKV